MGVPHRNPLSLHGEGTPEMCPASDHSPEGRATLKVMLLTAVWPCHWAITVAVAGPGQEVCGRQLQVKSPLPFACFTPCRLLLFATWPQAYTTRMLSAAPGRVWTQTCPALRST